jgi:GntR family transcriptional regulator
MILIDYKDRRPIYEQVVDRFQELILNGALEPDSKLPSVRNLAIDLSINPNTIQRAYATLEQKGYIYSVKGKGSFIASNQELVTFKKQEILSDVEETLRRAKSKGITYEEVSDCCRRIYEEGIEDD